MINEKVYTTTIFAPKISGKKNTLDKYCEKAINSLSDKFCYIKKVEPTNFIAIMDEMDFIKKSKIIN